MKAKSVVLSAIGGMMLLVGIASPSFADVDWKVSGKLSDGGSFSGSFMIDVYNYLSGVYSMASTAGSVLSGHVYSNGSNSNTETSVTFLDYNYNGSGYPIQLTLDFSGSLFKAGSLTLTGGYECVGFSTCGPGDSRSVLSGTATAVPGPEAGTGLLAAAVATAFLWLRRRRPSPAHVAA